MPSSKNPPTSPGDEHFHAAYKIALRLLNFQPRTVKQMRQKLLEKGIDAQTIQEVIDKFLRLNFLNDLTYAQNWIRMRNETNPRGSPILFQELKKKGVPKEIIEKALTEIAINQTVLVMQAAQKKGRTLSHLPSQKQRKRLLEFLSRRGFPYSVSKNIVNQLMTQNSKEL